MTEINQLEYHDGLVNFASLIQQHGIRVVMDDFKEFYPSLYQGMRSVMDERPTRTVPVLLRKPRADPK